MKQGFFHKLSSILWRAMVGVIVVLAIYVSFGRLLMANVAPFGEQILAQLNARSPFVIEAEEVTGEWHSFTPEIVLTGLRLSFPGSDEPPLELVEGRVSVDVLESVLSRTLQTFRISLDQLVLRGELTSEGKLLIAGMAGGGDSTELLQNFLLNIEQIQLSNNLFLLELPDGSQREFDVDLELRRKGSARWIDAALLSKTTGTEIAVLAKGLGNPFKKDTFSGDLYLDVLKSDLAALQGLSPREQETKLSGEVELQAWLAWDGKSPVVEAQITGKNIVISKTDESLQIPIDYLDITTSLKQREDRLTLFASDVELRQGDNSMSLPRLQFDVIGDSLRVRSGDISLAAVNALFLGLNATSDTLTEVFGTLDIRGDLSSVQLDIADYHVPLNDWELNGNFVNLDVESWRGAPGVHAEGGFVHFTAEGGYVLIDSHQFSMAFPTVYQEPLRFDDFYGKIFIDWTSEDVTLSSSLVMAQGIEGTATALFGLNIPLQATPVGLEMDLLVGLENSYPIHRTKYLPYTLNEGLLNWLKGSIGEGRIDEGAFLWRGSLKRDASAMRTVQLFFNVSDTNLNYYPGWPALSDLDGTVLIDDSRVSVWSENARLYGSSIDFLSAEAWMNDDQQMILAISSDMTGDAGDGIQIINQSPINAIVGGAFADWTMEGDLETHLELQLNLTDSAIPPVVDVATRWNAVNVDILPGDLRVAGIEGQLFYRSDLGFSSDGLSGEIWGKPLQAQVQQVNAATPAPHGEEQATAYDASTSVTEVMLQSTVEVADVRDWLDLELLSLADGSALVDVHLSVVPGEAPGIVLSSDLQGVTLDLPEPWQKQSDEVRNLRLETPLSGERRIVSMAMEDSVYMDLLLTQKNFEGMAMGFRYPPAPVEAGRLQVSGHTAYIDEAQWQAFLDRYVYGEVDGGPLDSQGIASEQEAPLDPEAQEGMAAAGEFNVSIDELRADTLILYGQDLRDIVFSLEVVDGEKRIVAEADWVKGDLWLNEDDSEAKVQLDYLDLSGLDFLDFSAGGEAQGAGLDDLPEMTVDVALPKLSYEHEELGHLLFTIDHRDSELKIENAVGRFAKFEMTEEAPGSVLWRRSEGDSQTAVAAKLQFTDLGESLQLLDYQNIIETSGGQFDLKLQWPGGPQDFSLDTASGALEVDIAEGRFLDTPSGASGTLKVVGILNLADIVQRLSLDLTDVFSSGIPFHSIEGEVFLHAGSIEVAKMDVKGRSSGFQFTGVSDVGEKSLNGELIATLPVANNLPWVAALAAGLPVAAGVFVVSKVFEKQMNRFSSAVYSIGGTWSDPEVNFDSIFDTSSAEKVILPVEVGDVGENLGESEAAAAEIEAADPNTPQTPAAGP